MRHVHLGLLAILLLLAVPAVAQLDADLARVRADSLLAAYGRRDAAAFRRDFAAQMAAALGEEKAAGILTGLWLQYGAVREVGDPVLDPVNRSATFPVTFAGGKLGLKIVLDAGGKIAGLWFVPPPAADRDVPSRNTVVLDWPVTGCWRVLWGGPTREQNQHHDVPCQRFALDLVAVDAAGRDHTGDGTRNEDYLAFGRPVRAPAAGRVVTAIRGVPDNTPGSMNPYSALGNCVILRLGEKQYLVLAHLRQGSLQVAAGDSVARGQTVGECGNSGNSSQPHLHVHLQHTATLQDGEGIEMRFDRLRLRTGTETRTVRDYAPVRGDVVCAGGG